MTHSVEIITFQKLRESMAHPMGIITLQKLRQSMAHPMGIRTQPTLQETAETDEAPGGQEPSTVS